MPFFVKGFGNTNFEVAGTTFRAVNVHAKPVEYGSLGHYVATARVLSVAAQAANARIFEFKANANNLFVITQLIMRATQTAGGTAQENSMDCYRCTGFTAVDTTNVATPVASRKRTSMAAAPGGALLRIMSGGATAGMTGGTLTKDTQFMATLPYNIATAADQNTIRGPVNVLEQGNHGNPLVLVNNEGFECENRVLNVTSYGIAWYYDVSWAEVTAF